jgi:hypothetical protein
LSGWGSTLAQPAKIKALAMRLNLKDLEAKEGVVRRVNMTLSGSGKYQKRNLQGKISL